MPGEWECPEVALKQARRAARRAHQQSRGLLDYDELVSLGYMWIAAHKDKVLEWSDKEQHPSGWRALSKSMLRYMNREVARERTRRNGGVDDSFYYTPSLVEEVLPDVWDVEDRVMSSHPGEQDTPRGKMLPGEGGNREAVIADVAKAVSRLHEQEKSILQARYFTNLTILEIAKMHGVSEDTVERRIRNTLQSVIDTLGGESPWRSRRPRSNAAALAETRNQWEGDDQ